MEIREKGNLETIRNDRENLPEELRDDLSGGFEDARVCFEIHRKRLRELGNAVRESLREW